MEDSCPATPLVLRETDIDKSPLQVEISSPESDAMKSPSRGSPDSHCVICLGRLQNKSFTDSCLHQFCFQCLLQWSKVKPECPLCKQPFKSIIHNVRSNLDYDQYHVGQPHCVLSDLVHTYNFEFIPVNRRFRYRSTMTREYFRELAETFLAHTRRLPDDSFEIPPMMPVDPTPARSSRRSNRLNATHTNHTGHVHLVQHRPRQRGTSDFRRNIYAQDLWVEDLADVSGRYRTCTPQFYRENPAQIHRIIPWLNREVNVLLNDCGSHAAYVLSQIVAILPTHSIKSREFREVVEPYFGERTDHFIHEFFTFARSVYDIAGFDQNAVYAPNPNYATEVQEILSSDDDSEIEILKIFGYEKKEEKTSSNQGFKKALLKRSKKPENGKSDEPVAGPSGIKTSKASNPIEICESDSDEVKVLEYVKPEPEVVTISSDDESPMFSDLDISNGECAEVINIGTRKTNRSRGSLDDGSNKKEKWKSEKGKCKSNGFGLKGKQKRNYIESRKSRSRSSTSSRSISDGSISMNSISTNNSRDSSNCHRSRDRSGSCSTITSTSSSYSGSSSNRTCSDKVKKNKSTSSSSRNSTDCKSSSKLKKKKSKISRKRKKKSDCKGFCRKSPEKKHKSISNSDKEFDKKLKSRKKVKSCVVVPNRSCDSSLSSHNHFKSNPSGSSSRSSEDSKSLPEPQSLPSYWSIALDPNKRDPSRKQLENFYQKQSQKSRRRDERSSSEEKSVKRLRDSCSSSEFSSKSSWDKENSSNKKHETSKTSVVGRQHTSWSGKNNLKESPIRESASDRNSLFSSHSATKTEFFASPLSSSLDSISPFSASRSPSIYSGSEKGFLDFD